MRIRRRTTPDPGPPACAAASVQLFFRPDGEVRVCCVNEASLGNVREQSLRSLWDGALRQQIASELSAGRFGQGCDKCAKETAIEGRANAYPRVFDEYLTPDGTLPDGPWPSLLDFNLSIRCNLQCIQCDGDKSSAIRLHREHRPPLASAYHDQFFDDLAPFLRHATATTFAGGEPFLAPENFRIWAMICDLERPPAVKIITNGTIWNDRVAAVVSALRPEVILSLDGATAATFEAVRVGADHAQVMANLGRFVAAGCPVQINHCLMVQNHWEFPDLLLAAEELGIHVNVSVVRWPHHCSIVHQPGPKIAEIASGLAARGAEMDVRLTLNRDTWVRELGRIQAWAAASDTDRSGLLGVSEATILGFPRQRDGVLTDVTVVLEHYSHRASALHVLTLDALDRVCSVRTLRGTPLDPSGLLGVTAKHLTDALAGAMGPMADLRVVNEQPDLLELTATFGSQPVRAAVFPDRAPDGLADTGTMLVAVVDDRAR